MTFRFESIEQYEDEIAKLIISRNDKKDFDEEYDELMDEYMLFIFEKEDGK